MKQQDKLDKHIIETYCATPGIRERTVQIAALWPGKIMILFLTQTML